MTPVNRLLWAVRALVMTRTDPGAGRAGGALWAGLRRAAGLILCLGAWTVAVFLVYDSALRWLDGAEAGRVMTGVLAFPFSLLAVAGALALTVRLVRRWTSMGETIAADPGAVDKDRDGSYLKDSAKDPHSEGR